MPEEDAMSDDLPTPERDARPDSSQEKGIGVPRRSMLLLGLGALAGLVPAAKAYRTDVAENLTPIS